MEVKNLTDQELNEWVAKEIMGWKMIKEHPDGWHAWVDSIYKNEYDPIKFFVDPHFGNDSSENFNPAHNLNHTYLMEEKIREMIDYEDFAIRDVYYKNLCEVVFDPDVSTGVFRGFNIIHASARQRCEAAWVTFNK